VGAHHASITNGVWVGIAVASLDSTLAVLPIGVVNPAPYRQLSTGISAGTPGGVALFALALGLAIGATIAHASPSRPRHRPAVR